MAQRHAHPRRTSALLRARPPTRARREDKAEGSNERVVKKGCREHQWQDEGCAMPPPARRSSSLPTSTAVIRLSLKGAKSAGGGNYDQRPPVFTSSLSRFYLFVNVKIRRRRRREEIGSRRRMSKCEGCQQREPFFASADVRHPLTSNQRRVIGRFALCPSFASTRRAQ